MIDGLSIAIRAFVRNVACLIKAHIVSFVCMDMEANAYGGSFQTMQLSKSELKNKLWWNSNI